MVFTGTFSSRSLIFYPASNFCKGREESPLPSSHTLLGQHPAFWTERALHEMQRAESFACRLVCGKQTSPHQKGEAWTCSRKMIPVNNCRQGCAMPWQWWKGSCITPSSGVERQIHLKMLHSGVRSFGAGQVYPTPAS